MDLKCIICKKLTCDYNVICNNCKKEINGNPVKANQYLEVLETFDRENKRRQMQNKRNMTVEHSQARRELRGFLRRNVNLKLQIIPEKMFRPFFVDLYLPLVQVGIEIDGGYHKTRLTYDEDRDKSIYKRFRVKIFRYNNDEVGTDYFLNSVLNIVKKELEERFKALANTLIKIKDYETINKIKSKKNVPISIEKQRQKVKKYKPELFDAMEGFFRERSNKISIDPWLKIKNSELRI